MFTGLSKLRLWVQFNRGETFVNTFMLQIAVLSNHLNGRDTHGDKPSFYFKQAQACQQQSQESQRSSRFQGFLAQPPGKGKREKPNEGTSNISEQGKKDMKQATKRSFK
ncbi:hypothetical protein NC653_013665 [Populus alba x Populus x berolinensis]|uniref:DOC domain-containing protein n=1 Tax=Populus alba x Populus x berolinensis TaxID=444605 RepID=A0AAD6W3U0_9ROSI|nr:hypothetical protein NC653_013665 [Populus alba x Populus x berolinensis]